MRSNPPLHADTGLRGRSFRVPLGVTRFFEQGGILAAGERPD